MKEIGGYLEIEYNKGSIFHEEALKLNCGRACLEYLIEAYDIRKIWLPLFLCDSVFERCRNLGLEIGTYNISADFSIIKPDLEDTDWLYLVNFYGLLRDREIEKYKKWHKKIICDNAQAFFQQPVKGVPTIYTCRKFLGVPDGAFLYSEKVIDRELELDESRERMKHLLGRFERTATEYYHQYVDGEKIFSNEPIKRMSKLTENLLRGIDYDYVKRKRTENWKELHQMLGNHNALKMEFVEGAFAYPFFHEKGSEIREALIKKQIYIPTLWSEVLSRCEETTVEYKLTSNLLPLPCDQRYGKTEMDYLSKCVLRLLS